MTAVRVEHRMAELRRARKASRALDAIEEIVAANIADDRFPVADRLAGLTAMRTVLFSGDVDLEQAAWLWTAVGAKVKMGAGPVTGSQIEVFESSRPLILAGLDARIAECGRPDPFDGLTA